MTAPLDQLRRLIRSGYGYVCPFCERKMDDGQRTGVYWKTEDGYKDAVCPECAPKVRALRDVDEKL